MRLGIVLDLFRRERGGTERYLAELATRLLARGHEVRVYCLDGVAPAPGVELVRIDVPRLGRARRERAFAERACARARADGCAPLLGIRHVLDVDVYQPHGGTWAASVAARLECERSSWRRALRGAAHRVSPKHRWFAQVDREVFARHRGLLTLAVSPLVREDVLARYGELAPRVEVVWPAVDVEAIDAAAAGDTRARVRRELGARDGALLLAFVAHDFELKGLAPAIEALARSDAQAAGATLLVVGRDRVAPYERLAGRLGVAASVRFLGERRDVAALLASSDLLLQPTRYDPCALTTLEALAAGTPVVTTRRNGAAALFAGDAGRVVEEPDDAAALAGAIDGLLAEGERARAAARSAGRSLGWTQHVPAMERWLEEGEASARARGRS